MKSSKIRKIQRAICADKSRITSDIQRITDMQQKVNDNYDWFKKYKISWSNESQWSQN